MLDRIPEWIEMANALRDAQELESPGKFEVVFDAYAVAALMRSLGAALEIDRVLGYEANAAGTSYLSPVNDVLGTAQLSPAVTIMADRSLAGGAATVQWDDEGISPQAFPLIKDGVLVDYATTREFIPELAGWYKKKGQPLRSHGCSASETALTVPLVRTPNLVLQPGTKNLSFDEMLAGIDNGMAVLGGEVQMDQQFLNGRGLGNTLYYVKKGKLAGPIKQAAYLFRTPDLWKDLVALGGPQTAAVRGFNADKGQPLQRTSYSVQAVAARFKNVLVRDLA